MIRLGVGTINKNGITVITYEFIIIIEQILTWICRVDPNRLVCYSAKKQSSFALLKKKKEQRSQTSKFLTNSIMYY